MNSVSAPRSQRSPRCNALAAYKAHHHLERDQEDHDPLEGFHAPAGGLVAELLVDAHGGLELAEDAVVPLLEVEARGREGVEAGEVLVADEFQGVVHALEEEGRIHLHAGDAPELATGDEPEALAPVAPAQSLVGTVQDV